MRHKIITLCGSARFEKEFHRIAKYLTLRGVVVFSLCTFPAHETGRCWYNDEQKKLLDFVHLKKISLSNAIVVITQVNSGDGLSKQEAYIGESTSNEIKWAEINALEVCYDYNGYYHGWGHPFTDTEGKLLIND